MHKRCNAPGAENATTQTIFIIQGSLLISQDALGLLWIKLWLPTCSLCCYQLLLSCTLPLTSTSFSSSLLVHSHYHFHYHCHLHIVTSGAMYQKTCTAIAGFGKLLIASSRRFSSVRTSCWYKKISKLMSNFWLLVLRRVISFENQPLLLVTLEAITSTSGLPWPNVASRLLWADTQASTWGAHKYCRHRPQLWKLSWILHLFI